MTKKIEIDNMLVLKRVVVHARVTGPVASGFKLEPAFDGSVQVTPVKDSTITWDPDQQVVRLKSEDGELLMPAANVRLMEVA